MKIDTVKFYYILSTYSPPQGPTKVGMRNGDPEVPKLPSVQGYSWATLSPGDINSETWSSRLGVGLTTPLWKKLYVKKPEAMPAGKEQMAGHSKGGQGLKQAVVPQKKKSTYSNSC
jgi:hypothetical protein